MCSMRVYVHKRIHTHTNRDTKDIRSTERERDCYIHSHASVDAPAGHVTRSPTLHCKSLGMPAHVPMHLCKRPQPHAAHAPVRPGMHVHDPRHAHAPLPTPTSVLLTPTSTLRLTPNEAPAAPSAAQAPAPAPWPPQRQARCHCRQRHTCQQLSRHMPDWPVSQLPHTLIQVAHAHLGIYSESYIRMCSLRVCMLCVRRLSLCVCVCVCVQPVLCAFVPVWNMYRIDADIS